MKTPNGTNEADMQFGKLHNPAYFEVGSLSPTYVSDIFHNFAFPYLL